MEEQLSCCRLEPVLCCGCVSNEGGMECSSNGDRGAEDTERVSTRAIEAAGDGTTSTLERGYRHGRGVVWWWQSGGQHSGRLAFD